MKTMTFGNLPRREDFDQAIAERCPDGYRVHNDKVHGTRVFTADELWEELNYCLEEWGETNDDASADWASCILSTLGFEWV